MTNRKPITKTKRETLTLAVSAETKSIVAAYADRHELALNVAARRLISAGLAALEPQPVK